MQSPCGGCGTHRQRTPTLGVLAPSTPSPPSQVAVYTHAQVAVGVDFVLLALLWISRDPKIIPGWGAAFTPGHVTDGTAARPGALVGRAWFRLLPLLVGRLSARGGSTQGEADPLGAKLLPRPRVLGVAAPKAAGSTGFGCGHTTGTVAITMALLLFALPSRPPRCPAAVARAVARVRSRGVRGIYSVRGDLRAEIEASELAEATGTAPAVVAAVVSRTAAGHRRFEALRDTSPDAGGEAAAAVAAAAAAIAGPASETRPRASEDEALVSWPQVQARLPWGVLLLFGGGFAVADGCAVSGISARVGENLSVLHSLPPSASVVLLMLVVSCSTAVTSNVATASIFVPVVAALAETMHLHPLYFMMPVALTCSLAFVLPVSTPPNAMAFATGRIQVADMVGVGLGLNAIGIGVVLVGLLTSGTAIFGLDEFPYWANASGEALGQSGRT